MALRLPRDYVAAGLFGLANFALLVRGYWQPPDRIFDEVYFARAAQEYLQNARIYENTHPPLSKLLVTLSVLLFGGLQQGNAAPGWRFLDVVFGALSVVVLYALAKRVTGSSVFAAMAALLFTLDGMHFVQSRIATPESFAVFFSLSSIYALYRFWEASAGFERASRRRGLDPPAAAIGALAAGAAGALIGHAIFAFDAAASVVALAYVATCTYLIARRADRASAGGWLLVFAIALGALVSTKWYGVMMLGCGVAVIVWWVDRRKVRVDVALTAIVLVTASVYALTWIPDLVRGSPDPNEIHGVNDVVARQYDMFHYHETLDATHPYASKWWEWPFDYVPVAYYYQDRRANTADPNGCCITEITSLPNPAILWFGLFCVPLVGIVAWRERNRGYALILLSYALQWLPWMASPRIAWEYHFYVDIPLVCLFDTIAFQRFWKWGAAHADRGNAWMAAIVCVAYVALVAAAFAYFYPILAAQPLAWNAWHARMWLPTWIIGPG